MKKYADYSIRLVALAGLLTVFSFQMPDASAQSFWDGYTSPEAVNRQINELHRTNQNRTKIHRMAVSPGGRELLVLEIGPEVNRSERKLPAIFVAANLEGVLPISTEAALRLAKNVLEGEAATDKTWYILPNGNPDAAARFFRRPLHEDSRNEMPHNDDMDDKIGEDGPEDINGDGFVTQMRVRDPLGEWIPVDGDPRLMRRADRSKGERGMYRLYSEGIDNDGDGQINEDPPGGVNVNRNFPQMFREHTATGGAWPGSTPEVYGMFQFVFSRPEIAMMFSFGETNYSLVPPRGGRQGATDFQNIQLPERFATQLGADPNKTYTMDEIIALVRPLAPPGFEINESVVASFLGLGAVVNPLPEDLRFYNELADRYKKFLKDNGVDSSDRLDPASDKDGSFELWAYYQVGVPTFSMDFWTLPKFREESDAEKSGLTAESIKSMSVSDFLELGEEKLDLFLREIGAPAQFSGAQVLTMVRNGVVTPERIGTMLQQMPAQPARSADGASPEDKALMAWIDNVLGGEGFVNWTTFNHPDLGEVEIGGPIPYIRTTPPYAMVDSLVTLPLQWVEKLSGKIAKLSFLKSEIVHKGSGIYEISVWVQNEHYLPFPTAMGIRNQQPRPAVIIVDNEGVEFLNGRHRTPFDSLSSMEVRKYTWLVRATGRNSINIRLETAHAWGDQVSLNLGGR